MSCSKAGALEPVKISHLLIFRSGLIKTQSPPFPAPSMAHQEKLADRH